MCKPTRNDQLLQLLVHMERDLKAQMIQARPRSWQVRTLFAGALSATLVSVLLRTLHAAPPSTSTWMLLLQGAMTFGLLAGSACVTWIDQSNGAK